MKKDLFTLPKHYKAAPLVFAATVMVAGCPKIDKNLPPLSEYVASEGWYEDAFIRVYKADLPSLIANFDDVDTFTHPWILIKPAYSNAVRVFEVREYTPDSSYGSSCRFFYPPSPFWAAEQYCGHVAVIWESEYRSITDLESAHYGSSPETTYTLGELRGGDAVDEIVDQIVTGARYYPCRQEYVALSQNSNTFVRAVLEDSGFYALYEETYGERFSLGRSSWGQETWESCSSSLLHE